MALIVENGTGMADAESYISVAEADTYHSNIGNATWATLNTTVKEQLLRKATNYMVQVYRQSWAGIRINDTQSLDFPRYLVPKYDNGAMYSYYDENSVPKEVKDACAEFALRANSGALAPDLDRLTKREKIGTLEVEYDNTRGVPFVEYRSLDNLLYPLMKPTTFSPSTPLVRA
jgi:hypothetical protein